MIQAYKIDTSKFYTPPTDQQLAEMREAERYALARVARTTGNASSITVQGGLVDESEFAKMTALQYILSKLNPRNWDFGVKTMYAGKREWRLYYLGPFYLIKDKGLWKPR